MTRRKIFFTGFLVWTIILIFLSLWPSFNKILQQDLKGFRWDYLEHFICYFILGLLYIFWRVNKNLNVSSTELVLFLAAGLIFSWLTEYVQNFVQGRTFNIRDMVSNMAGVIFGLLVSYYVFVRIVLKNSLKKKNQEN